MKKILIVIILLVAVGAGIFFLFPREEEQDFGTISLSNKEVYYKVTSYFDQSFYVLSKEEVEDGYLVRFTTDPEIDRSKSNYRIDLEPNTYIETVITEDQYNTWINDYESFNATLDVITLCVPIEDNNTDALFYTYVDENIDIEGYVNKAYNDAKNGVGNGDGRIGCYKKWDKIEKYLNEWMFCKSE